MEINIDNLSKEVYEITQNCGTEPPFSGKLLNEKRKGTYLCIVCKEAGWPSFFESIENKIIRKEDRSFGMIRTEITCRACNAHLGHVFPDGPQPTGERYCVNSLSMDFIADE